MTDYDSWLQTNSNECQIFDASHKSCCLCNHCECSVDVTHADELEIEESLQERVKSFLSEEYVCGGCVDSVIKKIELEAPQTFLDAEELNGQTYTMKEGG